MGTWTKDDGYDIYSEDGKTTLFEFKGLYWSREIVTTSAKNNVSEKVSCNR